MKSLITLVVFFMSLNVYALENQTVKSLNEGSCWLSSTQEGDVSIASFNDKRSAILTGFEVQSHIEGLLSEVGREVRGLNTFVHCSSHGLSVVFNVSTDRGDICLWSQLGERGELVRGSYGHLADGTQTKFCDGAKFGELMILTKGEGAREALVAELESMLGNSTAFEVKALGKDTYKVSFDRSQYGNESKLKADLLESRALVSVIRTVEYSSFYHPIGEVLELTEFSYHE